MVFSGALFALVALASTAISSRKYYALSLFLRRYWLLIIFLCFLFYIFFWYLASRSFQRRDASSALQGANAIGFSVAYSVCEISLQAFAVAALLG